MLDRLLESDAKRERFATGAVASIVTHTAVIGVALYATAHARVEIVKPPEVVRPVYFPQPRAPRTSKPAQTVQQPVWNPRLVFDARIVDISSPSVDATPTVAGTRDFVPSPNGALATSGNLTGTALAGDGAFRADQVDEQVAVAPGNTPPRYPEVLRAAGIEGRVVARFIVSEEGRAEPGSIRFARSDSQLFEDAVRSALGRMRFIPAQTAGKKVRQLVEMPFVFTLSR